MENTIGAASFSADNKYRQILSRIWDKGVGNSCVFIMLNPSTATSNIDDPTVRRCIGFAKSWGYGGLYILNLFDFISTNPNKQ